MSQCPPGIQLNGAPSQYERWFRSVGPGSVKPDARSFADLLSFVVQFGQLVRFYNLSDEPDGNWTPFFLNDPTIILASIAAIDLTDLEDRFMARLKDARGARVDDQKHSGTRDCCSLILDMVTRVDSWMTGAQSAPHSRPARLLAEELKSSVESELGRHLRSLYDIARRTGSTDEPQGPPSLDFRHFSAIWKIPASSSGATKSGLQTRSKTDGGCSGIEEIFRAFLALFRRLQEFASQHLPDTLLEDRHNPHVALYIAFVSLFTLAQATLNQFTRRFARFYYCEILRERMAGPTPDSLYLTLTLNPTPGLDSTSIPAGTQFPAGKEANGSAILYATGTAVSVSAGALASLRCLRVVTGPLYTLAPLSPIASPPEATESSPPLSQPMQQLLGTEIDLTTMNAEAAGKGPAGGLLPWATFGGTVSATGGIATTAPVTLGFAVASPCLMLTGGNRTAYIRFRLRPSDLAALEPDLENLAAVTGLSPVQVFERVVEQAFDLWLSGSAWFQVASYCCVAFLRPGSAWFAIQFTLPPSAPEVVAYNPPPAPPPPSNPVPPDTLNPSPNLPTLKAYLQQTPALLSGPSGAIETYPLALLGPIGIQELEIRTDTDNLTNLSISGSSGSLDPTRPFPLFGGTPVAGSYVDFSNEELFVKNPIPGSLSVNIAWYGLPANEDGFFGYYQGYTIGVDGQPSPIPLFDNETFVAELSLVNPGSWNFQVTSPPDPSPPASSPPDISGLCLFQTQNGVLCQSTVFANLDMIDIEPPPYYNPSDGAIRLTLTGPPYAFGNTLYGPNVLYATLAALPTAEQWQSVTVNPPNQPPVDATASLNTLTPQTGAPAPSSDVVRKTVQSAQGQVVQSARSYLSANLSKYGQEALSWVEQTFQVSGSKAPAYAAGKIGSRLRAALQSRQQSPPSSPPGLPAEANAYLQNAAAMLQPVISMQQFLDRMRAEPPSSYAPKLQTELGTLLQNLTAPESPPASPPSSPPAPDTPHPNPPWLPQAQGLSASYSSEVTVISSTASENSGSFFYLLPFGGYAAVSTPGFSLLPVPPSGSLELGFSGLDAPQSLSVLVQTAAGSVVNPPGVSWVWDGAERAQTTLDTTGELQNTGFLTFTVPPPPPARSTAATAPLRWLTATTAEPDGFPDMIGIYPNPLTATWVSDQGGSGQHLSQPLPPYTVNSSVQKLAGIQTISQPIESFGGLPTENEETFETRLSERLRHKDRAILPWDYEMLVLEEFPTVWKVRALSATESQGTGIPGSVLVVVVAGPQGQQVADPTEPLATADMLTQIQQYLTPLASHFAFIQVVNPVYVRVTVIAQVIFGSSTDGSGGVTELNSDLILYLSPWFYDAARAASRDSYASKDSIRRFIEARDYVTAVVEISLQYDCAGDTLPCYFLTSALSHQIAVAPTLPNTTQPGGGH